MNQEEKNENQELFVKQQIIPEETSKRITALRFLLAMLVVFIHNNYTIKGITESVEKGSPNIIFNPNIISEWIQRFISQGIARCAVPLFFLFAAYLQSKKFDSYLLLLKKKFKGLVIPYVIWVGLYLLCFSLVKVIVVKIAPSLFGNPSATMFEWSKMDWLHKIIGYGVDGQGLPEAAAQFWFVRDLVILVFISPIIYFFMKSCKVGFIVLISISYILCIKIYFVSTEGLFFYVLGLYWGYFNFDLFKQIDKIKLFESILVFFLCFIGTHTIYGEESVIGNFMHISACIILLKISKELVLNKRLYNLASYFAGYSFFLYAIHMPVLNESLRRVWLHYFPMKNAFFCLFEYFGVTILTIVIGTSIGILLKKVCPPLFVVLNGGRR